METWGEASGGYYLFEGRTSLGRSNQEDQVRRKTGMKIQGYASGRWKEKVQSLHPSPPLNSRLSFSLGE